jgi:hypothetical protein
MTCTMYLLYYIRLDYAEMFFCIIVPLFYSVFAQRRCFMLCRVCVLFFLSFYGVSVHLVRTRSLSLKSNATTILL